MSTQINISPVIKLEVNTTPITGGSAGQILFQTTGNTVGESANLFWDIAGDKLNLGSLGVQGELVINRASTGTSVGGIKAEVSGAGTHVGGGGYLDSIILTNGSGLRFNTWTGSGSGSAERLQVTASTGNVLVNTTTDAGFKLDVNGTARVVGSLNVGSSYGTFLAGPTTDWAYSITGGEVAVISAANIQGTTRTVYGVTIPAHSANLVLGTSYGFDWGMSFNIISTGKLGIKVNKSTDAGLIFANGNWGIGTTTDAGYKLDVNGTARVTTLSVTQAVNGINVGGNTNYSQNSISVGLNEFSISTDVQNRTVYLSPGNTNILKANFWSGGGIGGVAISDDGSAAVIAGAVLNLVSTTKGFLPPRMTTTQRNAIATPAAGLVVYDTTDNKHYGYNGTTWNAFY